MKRELVARTQCRDEDPLMSLTQADLEDIIMSWPVEQPIVPTTAQIQPVIPKARAWERHLARAQALRG